VDEQQRSRVRDDLHGFFKGEILVDDVARGLYSTDASIFQVRPLGVAIPRDEQDVQALVRYANQNGVALIARGAGTGVAGESLGSGLVIDLSKYFRQILDVGADEIRVQPGVTWAALQSRLARVGRRFAPDPASGDVCTVGGMLANDASGSRALLHGYTRDHVRTLRAVLDTGEAFTLGKEPVPRPTDTAHSHLHDILTALAVLFEEHRTLIDGYRRLTMFDRCGYRLAGVLTEGVIDLPRLLVGSEGTLALFTEATLRTLPLPGGQAVALLGFATLDDALRAAQLARSTGPAACELLDRRLLSLARGGDASRIAALVPAAVEAVLLVAYEADSAGEAARSAEGLVERMRSGERLAVHAVSASDPEQHDRLWQLREVALPSLYGLRGGAQPLPLVEDVGVPVEALPEFLRRVQEILQQHQTTASFLIHAGTGQVHTRPFLDLHQPEHVARLWDLAEQVHTLAIELGGTVSTQHGTGLARTPWVARQYGALYPVLRQVKAIFDPRNVFNPGKIVDGGGADRALRRLPTAAGAAWTLRWPEPGAAIEASQCNGCGHCRSELPGQRMCPIFRATQAEAASPRAKANLLRDLLAAGTNGHTLAADEVRTVADLCVNCKMCALECPAHVNIPKLMLEAKAANVAQHGLSRGEWFLARLENFVRWGSAFSLLANLALGSRTLRWAFERLLGLSPRRRMPRFALRTFMTTAKRRGWTRRPRSHRRCIAYFVDLYANYLDPQIAEATVLVLQHNGFDVYVPPGQSGCGIEALAHGDVDSARDSALQNVRLFADLIREGMTVVCSEPSAALMFRQDYADLVDDVDVPLLARHTVELMQFLADLHREGRLRTDFRAIDAGIGHHVPCHIKALGAPAAPAAAGAAAAPAGPALLALIPGLRVHMIDVSCSGMAGTYGLKATNYDTSLAAGAPMLAELRRPRALFGAAECSSCRVQMEDGAGKRSLHPVQYLALAYGLLPEVESRLQEPLRELTLR
jgi:FAD/FMN-containing dehydrogenase/Fe-S oxidoreductase